MIRRSESLVVVLSSRLMAPLIQIFGLYVIFHGHYSPGGGFQGGALLAASILLLRLTVGQEQSQSQFKADLGAPVGAIGVLVYAVVGLVALVAGAQYLDYHFLPLGSADLAVRRSLGILLVEVGVGVAVMATLVSIFDDLTQGGDE